MVWDEGAHTNIHKYTVSVYTLAEVLIPLSSSLSFSRQDPSSGQLVGWLISFYLHFPFPFPSLHLEATIFMCLRVFLLFVCALILCIVLYAYLLKLCQWCVIVFILFLILPTTMFSRSSGATSCPPCSHSPHFTVSPSAMDTQVYVHLLATTVSAAVNILADVPSENFFGLSVPRNRVADM